jgi:predicted MPP superfamily phosphohydrolase
LDRKFLRGLVEKANAMKPDMVVITGDLVDSTPGIIGPEIAELRRLQSLFGSFFVTGNHEYYSGVEAWLDFLRKMGIQPLMNERVVIGDSGASFDLAGIPDKVAGHFSDFHKPNLEEALKGRDPERELLLLAHRPEPIHEAAKHKVGLQLSGHTHGGQLWPSTIISKWVHPYSAGLHQHTPSTQIYVSRGAGFWGAPMRIAAPAELPLIVLSSA